MASHIVTCEVSRIIFVLKTHGAFVNLTDKVDVIVI